jgi:hypothetical protein
MPRIIAVALTAIILAIMGLTALSFAVHFLFSPWLLVVAVAILAWMKLRPRRSHR